MGWTHYQDSAVGNKYWTIKLLILNTCGDDTTDDYDISLVLRMCVWPEHSMSSNRFKFTFLFLYFCMHFTFFLNFIPQTN